MKNKIFSGGLFFETFRQLKIVGILGSVLYGFFGILLPIGVNIDIASTERYYYSDLTGSYTYVQKYIQQFLPEEMIIPSIIIAMIFVPVMMLVAFHFINKRNSCDFYHAIPVKRLPMYISIIFAVLAWTCIMTIIPSIAMGIMCGFLPYVEVAFSSLLLVVVKTLVLSVFVIGAFSIGISLSGTLFTNILISLMIMTLPRLLITAFLVIMGSANSFYPGDEILEIFFTRSNVFTQLFTMMTGSDSEYYISSYTSVVPTVIEGLCYCVAGGAVFVHRKSETAQKPSLSGKLQIVLRMIPAYIMGVVGVGFLLYYDRISVYYGVSDETIFDGIVFFVISILLYFIYELLTSRKWHAVLKSVKQLPILVGLVAVTFFAMKIISVKMNEFRIEPDKVQYIELKSAFSDYYFNDADIQWDILDTKISDAECIENIADAYNKSFDDDETDWDLRYCIMAIKQNGIIHYRTVYLPESVLSEALNNITGQNHLSFEKFLPEYSNKLSFELENLPMISSGQAKELYQCLKSDIEENSNFIDVMITGWEYSVDHLYIDYSDHGYYYRTYSIPISYKTPNTLELLARFMDETYEINYEKYWELIENASLYSGNIDMIIKTDTVFDAKNIWFDLYDVDDGRYNSDKIMEILDKYGQRGCATGENTVILSGFAYFEYDESYNSDNIRFLDVYSLTDEGMEQFIDAYNEIGVYYD